MNKKIIIGIAILVLLSISVSALTTKLPIFENGRLVVSKPGYYTNVKELTTEIGQQNFISIELEPFRYKNLTLKKYNIKKNPQASLLDMKKIGDWGLVPVAVELEDDEEAIVSITKINTDPYGEELFNVVRITSEETTGEIKLVPGTYDVEISLYYKPIQGSILIPQDRIRYKKFFKTKYITIPEIRAPGIWPLGTVNYRWNINASNLRGGNILEAYGVSVDIPGTPLMERKHKDLENLDKIKDFIRDDSMLRPRLK